MTPLTKTVALAAALWALAGCMQVQPGQVTPEDPPPGTPAELNGDPVGQFDLAATPVADDQNLERGAAFVDEAELEFSGESPVQVDLVLRGSLPTPCHSLRWTAEPPDEQGRINIEVYSLYDPALSCIQVLEPMEATIPIGSFTEGSYSIWVNGEQVGEFEP